MSLKLSLTWYELRWVEKYSESSYFGDTILTRNNTIKKCNVKMLYLKDTANFHGDKILRAPKKIAKLLSFYGQS